jgi:hypothetical protein
LNSGDMRRYLLVGAISVALTGCATFGSATPSPTATRTSTPSAKTAQPTASVDPRAELCGAGTLGPVLGMFAVDHASEIRTHIPNMLKSPELDDSEAPAFVVMFDGPVHLPVVGGPGSGTPPPAGYAGVVCVALDLQPILYTNVDTTGWQP